GGAGAPPRLSPVRRADAASGLRPGAPRGRWYHDLGLLPGAAAPPGMLRRSGLPEGRLPGGREGGAGSPGPSHLRGDAGRRGGPGRRRAGEGAFLAGRARPSPESRGPSLPRPDPGSLSHDEPPAPARRVERPPQVLAEDSEAEQLDSGKKR